MSINKLPRLLLILAIFGIAGWLIFHRPPKLNVPAVRLVYDIKSPAGSVSNPSELSSKMIQALRTRIDPNDVYDLVWQPLGPAQIEILVPSRQSGIQPGRGIGYGADVPVSDLKRLLQGSGVLEYHILAREGGVGNQAMQERMKPQGSGPAVASGDTLRWFQVDRLNEVQGRGYVTATYHDHLYVLAWMTPEKSLDHRAGQKPWALTNADRGLGQNGEGVVSFSFDAQGATDFGRLTAGNINQPLGMFLSGKMINAAVIRSMITTNGQIDGGAQGFTKRDLDYLVNTLRAGSLPAELSDEPVVEENVRADLESPWRRVNVVGGIFLAAGGLVLTYFLLIRRRRRAVPPPLPATFNRGVL
jgi:preprotein translocase subunit SecD